MIYLRPEKRTVRLQNVIYDKNLNERQKEVIEYGLDCGLTDDELLVLANSELTYEQMKYGLYGFMCNLSIEDVESYLKPEYSIDIINQLRFACMKPNEHKLLNLMIADTFNESQLLEIRKGSVLPRKYVEMYAVSCFNAEQMKQIRLGFENSMEYEKVCFLCDARLNVNQMKYLRALIENGLDIETLQDVAQPDIPEEDMYQLLRKLKREHREQERLKHMMYNLNV